MRILLTAMIVVGSIADAKAAESYENYNHYFAVRPVVTHHVKQTPARRKPEVATDIDTRRHDEGSAARSPDSLKPGYRGSAGTYVLPEYSTHPSSLAGTGFGSPASDAYGSLGAANPFSGTLGTRR